MKQYAAYPLLLLLLLALSACASNLATPTNVEQKLGYAYAGLAAARDTTASLLERGRITVDEARQVQSRADQVRTGLDASKAALDAGKPESAMESLETAQKLLIELENYLNTKGGS